MCKSKPTDMGTISSSKWPPYNEGSPLPMRPESRSKVRHMSHDCVGRSVPPLDIPAGYITATVLVDTSNPNVWILPQQSVVYRHAGWHAATIESSTVTVPSHRYLDTSPFVGHQTDSASHIATTTDDAITSMTVDTSFEFDFGSHWDLTHLFNHDALLHDANLNDALFNFDPFQHGIDPPRVNQWKDWNSVLERGPEQQLCRGSSAARQGPCYTSLGGRPLLDTKETVVAATNTDILATQPGTSKRSKHRHDTIHSAAPNGMSSTIQRYESFDTLSVTDCTSTSIHIPETSVPVPPRNDSSHTNTGSSSNEALLLKPLTAYNYFYRVERDNIVTAMKLASDPIPDPVTDYSPEQYQALLHQHWYVDPGRTKRQHRRGHGVMDFLTLSTVISQRWQNVSTSGRDFYQRVAQADRDHYKRCMARRNNKRPREAPNAQM